MIDTSSPVQSAISCPLRPRSRSSGGVKALMCPSAANWTAWQHRNRTLAPRQESFTLSYSPLIVRVAEEAEQAQEGQEEVEDVEVNADRQPDGVGLAGALG